MGHGVLVGEDSYCALLFQDFQHSARGFILENWPIAGEAAVAIDEGIDALVVDGARHIMQRETIERVGEGGEFPCADVTGEIEDTFALLSASQEIFVAVQDDELFDVFPGVFGKAREFGRHPA